MYIHMKSRVSWLEKEIKYGVSKYGTRKKKEKKKKKKKKKKMKYSD